jgi:hypothetical protein
LIQGVKVMRDDDMAAGGDGSNVHFMYNETMPCGTQI